MKIEEKKSSKLAFKKHEVALGLPEIGKFEEKSKKYRERMNQSSLN